MINSKEARALTESSKNDTEIPGCVKDLLEWFITDASKSGHSYALVTVLRDHEIITDESINAAMTWIVENFYNTMEYLKKNGYSITIPSFTIDTSEMRVFAISW